MNLNRNDSMLLAAVILNNNSVAVFLSLMCQCAGGCYLSWLEMRWDDVEAPAHRWSDTVEDIW